MKRINLFFIATILIFLIGCTTSPNKEKEKIPTEFKTISTGSTNLGDVSIELTPVKESDAQLVFDIIVNTHSVDLSQYNLKEITTLEYNGKSVKPISAPNLGGHHAQGRIVFDVQEQITNFIVKINGIPKTDERIFKWD